ncbi:sensor histidine kinase [Gemmobacter aquaticus]|uniref:histidine kinase n=1 Tax=Gemmobacter aquaticus TaxID=490185 RepID=A0A917YP50_9RHOB|nr:sensor histidine kinase [Gemmobacter aquaticus]GGO37734.1 sensor histidine kinase [Gemmobacter aquaticus]
MGVAQRSTTGKAEPVRRGEVLLGEDWVSPEALAEQELRAGKSRRGLVALNHSPLARKIVVFNMLAIVIMVAGVLFMNPSRNSLVQQRERGLVTEARLLANFLEVGISGARLSDVGERLLGRADIGPGMEVLIFDTAGRTIAQDQGVAREISRERQSTLLTDFLNLIWDGVSVVMGGGSALVEVPDRTVLAKALAPRAITGDTLIDIARGPTGGTLLVVATPIRDGARIAGVVTLASPEGEIDNLVSYEREQILRMFVIALLVSIGLSLVLASTIANPLSDLAIAAELGRDRDMRKMAPGRVRIPDLTARPDEIGRLSVAIRGMVSALYERIDANEQFAADVSHEIKNPLASLRSAVASLHLAKRDDQRARLLEVIDHDVRRLDRLVSDISNASRLDSELVKEEEEEFNLLKTIANLSEYLGQMAEEKGVEFIADLPSEAIVTRGLEGRLAQVFVNLITNAISFCDEGDAVRVWVRRRENRVLVVVEDTGPGIPDEALTKIFNRFYSERPSGDFGNHSGLGLAISKQIVEAHGGVIWAENIRPSNADLNTPPLGARFVVGLPV